jgi:hypothetical protein
VDPEPAAPEPVELGVVALPDELDPVVAGEVAAGREVLLAELLVPLSRLNIRNPPMMRARAISPPMTQPV